MEEGPSIPSGNGGRRGSRLVGAFQSDQAGAKAHRGTGAGSEAVVKGTKEKMRLLGRHLGNVEELVADLRESAPFGGRVC